MNPYLKQYNPGGKVIVDGKEVNTSSQEYKDLYDAGVLMGVDYEGLPNMYAPEVEVTATAPDWLKVKRGEMTESMRRDKASMSELGNEFANQTGIAGAYKFAKDPVGTLGNAAGFFEDLMMASHSMPKQIMHPGEYKPEHVEGLMNTLDVAGLASAGAAMAPKALSNIKKAILPVKFDSPSYVTNTLIDEIPQRYQNYRWSEKNPETGWYDVYNEKFGIDEIPTRDPASDQYLKVKMKSLLQKQDGTFLWPVMDYLRTKGLFPKESWSITDKLSDPVSGLLQDGNTRYWLNKRYNPKFGLGSNKYRVESKIGAINKREKFKPLYSSEEPIESRWTDIVPQNRYGGQNPYMKYANGGPVDPVDPEEEKRLMQERLMRYIRGNNEDSPSILDVRAPNEYGVSLGDRFNIQSGLLIDPMTGMPSGYGKLGVNSNGFNIGVEKKKGFGTDANIFNLVYESPKFNIDASYSNENNMPSIRGNVGYNNNGINIGFGGNYSPFNKSISANLGYNKNGFNAGLNYDYSGQHSMSGNVGYGNKEYNVGLSGNIMPSESNIGLNATYNLGVRKPQKKEEISMAYNKPIEINLIKEDEDTDAEQAAGPPEMNYGGYVNPYMPTYGKGGDTKTSEEKVNCTNCGWSWKLSEGGDDPYMCHECNHDNSQEYKETTNKQQYEKGGDTGHSTVEIERNERVYTPDGNLIMETPSNAPTHEEGGVKVTLPGGSLVFPKKYFKSLDAASGLPAFKKITNTMLDNAEKAYLRGEAYSSGGKRK